MLRFLAGTETPYFTPRIGDVLELASVWALRAKVDVDVNALADKQHSVNTLHTWGLAVDLDTAGDKLEDLKYLYGFLARYLPLEYDVILEKDHVHVEYDMHRHSAPVPQDAAPAPLKA